MKKKKDNNEEKISISPDLFLKSSIISFNKASEGFFTLSKWCESILYIKEMGDKINNGYEPTNTEETEIAHCLILCNDDAGEELVNKSIDNINKALTVMQHLTKMDLDKKNW